MAKTRHPKPKGDRQCRRRKNYEVDMDPTLNRTDKAVYHYIASRSNDQLTRPVWGRQQTHLKILGCSARTFRSSVKRLKARGHLDVEPGALVRDHATGKIVGREHTNRFRICNVPKAQPHRQKSTSHHAAKPAPFNPIPTEWNRKPSVQARQRFQIVDDWYSPDDLEPGDTWASLQ